MSQTAASLLRILTLFLVASFAYARPTVRDVTSKAELDRILNYHALTGMPVMIDYYSNSCGPCRMIEPVYKNIAQEYKNKAVFLKVNVQSGDAAQGIRSMPTFRAYFRGKKVNEFSGADEGQIRRTMQQYVNKAKNHNPMKIREPKTRAELKQLFQHAAKMPVLVAFVSKTNEDSKAVWPTMKSINKQYNGKVVVVKVNVEERADLADFCKADVNNIPIFHIYVKGKKVDECKGPDGESLENMVTQAHQAHKKHDDSGGSKSKKSKPAKKEKVVEKKKAKRPTRRSAARVAYAKKHAEKVVVLGAGPAGLSAAIYAARAGLNPVLIAPNHGGQLTYTKEVENFPGFPDATGESLIDNLRLQAEKFDTQFEATVATHVDLSVRPFVITTNQTDLSEGMNIIKTQTLIIATGADSVWLGVPGETKYQTKGVTTCATCDGYLFKGKPVVVIGGGDSAMEEALYMARIAKKVTLVHRRDDFRASYILQQRVRNHQQIEIKWNSEVQEFVGDKEGFLNGAVIKNKVTGETETLNIDGAFIAIGHRPNTGLFKGQLGMDQTGFLHTSAGNTHATVEGVFACGDVADNVYRQAVTSAATGAMAAIDAERWLDEQGIDVGDGHAEPGDVDYTLWSVKELKNALKDKGISSKGCFEKSDFIRELTKHNQAAPVL